MADLEEYNLQYVNFVCKHNLAINLPHLGTLANKIELKNGIVGVEKTRKFAALKIAVATPESSRFLLYQTGVLMCIGCRNVEQVKKHIKLVVSALYDTLGISKEGVVCEVKIENTVSHGTLNGQISLSKQNRRKDLNTNLEPEFFPGCTLTVRDKIKSNLFGSGKFTIVGAKSSKEVEEGLEFVHKHIKNRELNVN